MTDTPDPAAFRAQLDQAQAGLRDLAAPVAEFWKALMAAGMSEGAATIIVAQWVAAVVQQSKP